MKNEKNKENKTDDKVTIDTTPAPGTTSADTNNASTQDDVSTDSNPTYSLRNCKFAPYSTTTTKPWKIRKM